MSRVPTISGRIQASASEMKCILPCAASSAQSCIWAIVSMCQQAAAICRNRGTEFAKCPEMLTVDLTKGLHDEWPGAAADVWGLGCLLYELLAARLLFEEADWTAFYNRLTTETQVCAQP